MDQSIRALLLEVSIQRFRLQGVLQRTLPPIVVDTATCKAQAQQLLTRLHYDIALVSLDLPGDDGLQLIAQIRGESPQTHVVAISADCTADRLARSLSLGAGGFLVTNEDVNELQECLHGVRRGHPVLCPQALRLLMRAYRSTPAVDPASPGRLTPKQREVLADLAKGHKVKRTAVVLGVRESTVQSHIKQIYSRLNIRSRAEAVAAASRMGLM